MERAELRRIASPVATWDSGEADAGAPAEDCCPPAVSPDAPSLFPGSRGAADPLRALWSCSGMDVLATLDLSDGERVARDVVAPEFDRAYYLLTNRDVCSAGIEPLHHYLRSGWREGRRPVHWFDPAQYRAAYPEVDESGLEPFAYFIRSGRVQGHAARRRNGPARHALRAARLPEQRRPAPGPATVMHLHCKVLQQQVRDRLAGACGLTVAVSHDLYLQNVGGIQGLVASEQAAFNALGESYLHLAPVIPLMTLAAGGPGPHYLHVTMDGVTLGVATGAEVLEALNALADEMPDLRRLVVHCLLGHAVALVPGLYERLHTGQGAPPEAVFWAHDYEAICVGFNLLRNDVAFCGAPPDGSPACAVCVYGGDRPGHLAAMQALFHAVPFRVVAPSAAALSLWQRKSGLPCRSAEVGAVLRVEATATRRRIGAAAEPGNPGNPVRIAFAGYPAVHKGWAAFVQVAAELERSGAYRLFHFSSGEDQKLPGVEHVPVRVSPAEPGAMVSALAAAGVDLVLVLSPWPETFCIVAHEALAAGADVLTLACSGNVADLVRETGRGRVFADADGVAAYLASAPAILDARARQEAGAEAGRIRLLGATAGLPPRAEEARAAVGDAHGTMAGAA